MVVRHFILLCLLACANSALAQSSDLPLNSPTYRIYDHWDILSDKSYFTTVKPISRQKMASATSDPSNTSRDLTYVQLETREFLDSSIIAPKRPSKRVFQYESDFFAFNNESFDLHLNPVIAFNAGKESRSGDVIFENYRGVELRGLIDKKVAFYTLLTENQARYPEYVRAVTDSTLGVPYEGFWKQYDNTGVDFLRAQAYIDVNLTSHIRGQFGYGKHFIGDGRRSLILSDFGNNYPYFKLQTEVWKLQYTNIYAKLISETTGGVYGLDGVGSFGEKYLALHHLGVNITDNFNLGLFESIIYGRPDSLGNHLRMEYLNPIIFYRSLEQQNGSADNAMLGLDFKWNIWNRVSLYGQLVIDELIVSKALSGKGYWENKQGFQLGGKYIDAFGIDGLLVQAEWNQVRPYTYSHQDNYTSYSHYNLPLAHPLGANFREVLFSARYQINPKLTISGDWLIAQSGRDTDGTSYGGNILKSYGRKTDSEFVELLQGEKTDLSVLRGRLTYQWIHNLNIEAIYTYRREQSANDIFNSSNSILNLGIRYNFPFRDYLF